jgi:hypothetical protein
MKKGNTLQPYVYSEDACFSTVKIGIKSTFFANSRKECRQ